MLRPYHVRLRREIERFGARSTSSSVVMAIYDKLAVNYLAWVTLATAIIWL
jgi:hypothetical protein